MPAYLRPGVYTTEQLTAASPPVVSPTTSATAGFIGEHWSGPSNTPILCNGWADFVRYFGGFNSTTTPVLANPYLAYSVFEFFANGGQNAYVARIVSGTTPGNTASVTLADSAATPQNTLKLTAGHLGVTGNPGSWGNNLHVVVANRPAGASVTGRFDLTIYNGSVTQANAVESWIDLSMSKTDPRYAPTIINSITSGSLWVVATDMNSVTAAPNNAPAVVTVAFTGGTDGSDPAALDYTNLLNYGSGGIFDQIAGMLNINIPGNSTAAVLDAAIVYAQNRPYTWLVLETASGQTPASAVSFFQSLSPVASQAGIYYPWVLATNPAANSLSSTILLPPGGFVLGQTANTDLTVGPWKAPAGIQTQLNAVQTERVFSPSDLDTLNSNNVNALKTLANGAVVIWGARTMQTGYSTQYVPIRRFLNYIENYLVQSLQFAIFQPNNPALWTQIAGVATHFLSTLVGKGAFASGVPGSAYYVICDGTNNTAQTISQGVVNTQVGVALAYPAEFISILITQVQSTGVTTSAIL